MFEVHWSLLEPFEQYRIFNRISGPKKALSQVRNLSLHSRRPPLEEENSRREIARDQDARITGLTLREIQLQQRVDNTSAGKDQEEQWTNPKLPGGATPFGLRDQNKGKAVVANLRLEGTELRRGRDLQDIKQEHPRIAPKFPEELGQDPKKHVILFKVVLYFSLIDLYYN